MIVHQHRCIFFHVPRTAGKSVEVFLLGFLPDTQKTNRDCFYGWDAERRIFLQHATCAFLREQVTPAALFRHYFKFAVVRNPFSRLLSVYHYNRPFAEPGSFRDFVFALPKRFRDPRLTLGNHFSPQHLFTHIDGELVVDSVLRFEKIAEEMADLAGQLGLKGDFPHLNSAKWARENVALHYDDEMRELVLELYALDFELFDYSRFPG